MDVITVLVNNYKNSTKDLHVVAKIILALVLAFILVNIIIALVGVFSGQA